MYSGLPSSVDARIMTFCKTIPKARTIER